MEKFRKSKAGMYQCIALVLLLSVFFSSCLCSTFSVSAAESSGSALSLGEQIIKSAAVVNIDENRPKISLEVAGDGKNDEYILMLDASSSVEDYNWESTLKIIDEVATNVLKTNDSSNILTLMAFGISPYTVARIESIEEYNALKPELDPDDLLFGRSATNCEASINHIIELIKSTSSSTRNAYVIYVTDGETNMSEEPVDFQNWVKNTDWYYARVSPETLIKTVVLGYVVPAIIEGRGSDPVAEEFGYTADKFKDMSEQEILEYVDNDLSAEAEGTLLLTGETGTFPKWRLFGDHIWAQVFKEANLTTYNTDAAYSASQVQNAFVQYDINHYGSDGSPNSVTIANFFYYAVVRRSYIDGGYSGTRASEAMNELIKLANVDILRFRSRRSGEGSNWLNPENGKIVDIENDNLDLNYINCGQGDEYEKVAEQVATLAQTFSDTPYNNVTITDYMSKWVHFVPDSIKIYDVKNENQLIYDQSQGGWMVSEDERPVKSTSLVEVVKVSSEDYQEGGDSVIGNTNGDIYKLVWKAKDGALLTTDSYRLEYEITVDIEETGFEFDKDYPANGNTVVNYAELKNGEEIPHEDPIRVPTVNVTGPTEDPEPITPEATTPEPTTTKPTTSEPMTSDGKPDKVTNEISSKTPDTGDSSHIALWFTVMTAAVTAVLPLFKKRRA